MIFSKLLIRAESIRLSKIILLSSIHILARIKILFFSLMLSSSLYSTLFKLFKILSYLGFPATLILSFEILLFIN